MPNDCYNIIECIKHDNPEIIKRLKENLSKEPPVFFADLIPCPPNELCTSYWGTKWDVYDVNIIEVTENALHIAFYTAWSPPLLAYGHLKKLGFNIDAQFMESGYDFCGSWKDGVEIIYDNVRDNLDNVPEEFHFYFQDDEDDD